MVRLKSLVQESVAAPTLLILPGIDGNYCNFEPLAANLSCHVFCLQYDDNYTMDHTIDQIAEYLLSCLHGYLSSSAPFVIAAYSMSSVMAVHLVSVLEKEGKTGQLILIDGSPQMLQTIITHLIPDTDNEHMLQSFIMTGFVKSYIAFSDILKLKNSLLKCKDFDEQMDLILEHVPKRFRKFPNHTKNVVKSAFGRCKAIITYKPKFKKLKTIVTLIKPKKALLSEISHDYDLQNLCQAPVQVHVIEGNHHSMLKSDNLQLILNKIVNNCEAAAIE
ncbi:hypothetical protein FQA39_LY18546 [Lamprigera yunnana]|nr:hypothetical protein FQA39_LY18546 [Lamprigera yunnana]